MGGGGAAGGVVSPTPGPSSINRCRGGRRPTPGSGMTWGSPRKAPPMVSSGRRINSSACVITPENYPSRIWRPASARRREAALEAGEAMTELPARARGGARALRALDRLEDHPAGGGEVAPPVLVELRELL